MVYHPDRRCRHGSGVKGDSVTRKFCHSDNFSVNIAVARKLCHFIARDGPRRAQCSEEQLVHWKVL